MDDQPLARRASQTPIQSQSCPSLESPQAARDYASSSSDDPDPRAQCRFVYFAASLAENSRVAETSLSGKRSTEQIRVNFGYPTAGRSGRDRHALV